MLKEELKGHPVLLGHLVQRVSPDRPASLNPDYQDHPVLLGHLVQRVSPDHQDRRVHKV